MNSELSMTQKRPFPGSDLQANKNLVFRICVVMHNARLSLFREEQSIRATGNFNRAPNLHALCASKVFAVEGRFMTRHGGISSTKEHAREDRPHGADVETVNHGSANRPEQG